MDKNLRKWDGWTLEDLRKNKGSFTGIDGAPGVVGSEEAVRGLRASRQHSEMKGRRIRDGLWGE